MLRASEKRMLIGERLPQVFGGRALRRYPEFKTPRLDVALVPPVASPLGWYDASHTSSLTLGSEGGRVSAWADRSASALNAAEETSTAPAASVVVPNAHHGRGVIMGRGAFSFTVAGLSAADRTQTVFFCGCIFSFSAAARTMIGATANNGRLFRVETSGRLACVKRNSAVLATASAAMTITAGTPFAAALILDTNSIDFRFNRVTQETFAESTTFSAATGSHIGGGDATTAQRPPGYVSEVIFYDGAMSSGNADLVMDYLMAKWEID